VQITIPMYILLGLQLALLPFQLISYISRRSDARRKRILVMALIYVLLNVTWIASNSDVVSVSLANEVLSILGVFAIGYTYYYCLCEFEIAFTKPFLARLILFVLVLFAAISFFNRFFGELDGLARIGVFLYAELVVLFFVSKIILRARSTASPPFDIRHYGVLFAAFFSICVPFILIYLSNENLKFITINVGFMSILFAYISFYVNQMQIEWFEFERARSNRDLEDLEQQKIAEILDKFATLTAREVEVSKLMVQQLLWKEIADRLNIEESTARKHGANIYSKFGVSKLDEFIEVVSSLKKND
jgi:DNA-binding CsgD family transcriptional regulator